MGALRYRRGLFNMKLVFMCLAISLALATCDPESYAQPEELIMDAPAADLTEEALAIAKEVNTHPLPKKESNQPSKASKAAEMAIAKALAAKAKARVTAAKKAAKLTKKVKKANQKVKKAKKVVALSETTMVAPKWHKYCEVKTSKHRLKGKCKAYSRFCKLYTKFGLHAAAKRHCDNMKKAHAKL